MHTTVSRLLQIAIVVLLGACAGPTGFMSPKHPYDYRAIDEAAFRTQIISDLKKVQTAEDEYYKKDTTPEQRRFYREQIVAILLDHINEFWRKYRSEFYGDTAFAKVAMDSSAGAIAGAAAITSPASAVKILATVSAAISGVNANISKDVLQEKTAALLLSQMESDRKLVGLRIVQGNTKDVAQYPLANALADIAEYASAMSVPSALASLQAAAGAPAQAAKAKEAAATINAIK